MAQIILLSAVMAIFYINQDQNMSAPIAFDRKF